jgi:pimeloyl-ACP methyl ester carboxylesterase
VFELGRPSARVRLAGAGQEPVDALLDGETVRLVPADLDRRPDALLTADEQTWAAIARDIRGGMTAFRAGKLSVRHDLHLGVGFLAATAAGGEAGLRFRRIRTAEGGLSVSEASTGFPVVILHGLGATKVSFLPTVAALADSHRPIAVDLPGFGDSVKPIRASYDAAYFAKAVVAMLDALELERAHIVGNSMGGRVAIEVGLRAPDRVATLGLLAPSLAWLRDRPWAPFLRFVSPQLGLIQPAPRPVVEGIVRLLIPGADEEWTAAGIDAFLRSYLTPRGRAAFYAAARSIYLEEPHGPDGFWTRLPGLRPPSLFVWGRRDGLVPIRSADHVRRALPAAEHVELDCGHVPQLERPKQTHAALIRFFGQHERRRGRAKAAQGQSEPGWWTLGPQLVGALAGEEGGRDAVASSGTWVIRQHRRWRPALSYLP